MHYCLGKSWADAKVSVIHKINLLILIMFRSGFNFNSKIMRILLRKLSLFYNFMPRNAKLHLC
jgi:cellulose biosynthesis protein BcsQ